MCLANAIGSFCEAIGGRNSAERRMKLPEASNARVFGTRPQSHKWVVPCADELTGLAMQQLNRAGRLSNFFLDDVSRWPRPLILTPWVTYGQVRRLGLGDSRSPYSSHLNWLVGPGSPCRCLKPIIHCARDRPASRSPLGRSNFSSSSQCARHGARDATITIILSPDWFKAQPI